MESPMTTPMRTLTFDNTFVRELPADPDPTNERRQVLEACYSRVKPTPVRAPETVAVSREVAEGLLGLSEADQGSARFAEVFAGNALLPGMEPYAACYGGHQFGNWAGQLGDGRAIGLGHAVGPDGRRWELQLKGAGPTPYSRTADGRAVLRSSVREFLCSEAMHHLGVPTTRALSLVKTGERVVRDMFYDGNPEAEQGAVVCRVAPSFIRFGNFEIFAWRRDPDTMRALVDYTITHHFPALLDQAPLGSPELIAAWVTEVAHRTAVMIVHWMRVGFVHGVMNTDNMSILGLTIDYGPYGWLDDFDPNWTPNTTDAGRRRYRYANQPGIALWNLVRLANALLPLVDAPEPLQDAVDSYSAVFEREHRRAMAAKLGLARYQPGAGEDDGLVDGLLEALTGHETDMTLFYRGLADVAVLPSDDADAAAAEALTAPLAEAWYGDPPPEHVERVAAWVRRYMARVRADGTEDAARRERMNAANPLYVMRNYLAQLAIDDAERGDYGKVRELLEVRRRPYTEQPGRAAYAQKRPEWARNRPGCSMLSCSS